MRNLRQKDVWNYRNRRTDKSIGVRSVLSQRDKKICQTSMKTNSGRNKGWFTEQLGQWRPSPKNCSLKREDSIGKGSTL